MTCIGGQTAQAGKLLGKGGRLRMVNKLEGKAVDGEIGGVLDMYFVSESLKGS